MAKYTRFILISLVLVLSSFISPSTATNHIGPMTLGTTGTVNYTPESSQSFDAVIFNSFAYIADGMAGLRILNISNPSSPQQIGLISFGSSIQHIENYDDLLIISGPSNVIGYNISSAVDPVKLFEINEHAESFTVVGNYLYLGGWETLKVYKLSSTYTNPQFQTSTKVANIVKDLLAENDILYVSLYGDGVASYDISKRVSPVLQSYIPVTDRSHELRLYQDMLLVADTYYGGISLVNVSNPASLVLQGSANINGIPRGIDLVNATLYVSTTRDGIQRLNVSDPANPYMIDQYHPATENLTRQLYLTVDVVVDNGIGVISMEQYGFHLFNTSDSMTFLSVINPYSSEFISIKKSSDLVFAVSKYDGVWIYNENTGPEFDQSSLLSIEELDERFITSIEVVDNYLYIKGSNALHVYQYWNNGTTQFVQMVSSTIYNGELELIDNHTLILREYHEMVFYDVSNRTNPLNLYTWQTSDTSQIRDLVMVGDLLAVVERFGRISFLDYLTTGGPTLIKTIEVGENLASGAYFNNLLYIGLDYSGFRIYDISELSAPKKIQFDYFESFSSTRLMDTLDGNLFMYTFDGLYSFNLTASPYLTTGRIDHSVWGITSMSIYENGFLATKGLIGFTSATLNYSPANENFNQTVSPPDDNNPSEQTERSEDGPEIRLLGSSMWYLHLVTITIIATIVRKRYSS